MHVFRRLLSVMALLLAAGTLGAEPCVLPTAEDADAAVTALEDLRIEGCLDQRGCNAEEAINSFLESVCGRIGLWEQGRQEALEAPGAEPAEVRGETEVGGEPEVLGEWLDRLPAMVTAIRDTARDLAEDAPGRAVLNARLEAWREVLVATDPQALERRLLASPTAEWQPQGLVLFAGHPDQIDLEAALDARCETPASCRRALHQAASVYTLALLQRRVLLAGLERHRTATLALVEKLDRRWEAYLAGGRGFYPWEEALNGWLHQRRHGERGFVQPPRRQVLVLHPGAALAYRGDAADRLEEALTLELLGIYRWRWAEDDSMQRPFGASLTASWTGARGDDPGIGLLVHLPGNWSVGTTYADGDGDDWTVLLGVDLAKMLRRGGNFKERLRRLR